MVYTKKYMKKVYLIFRVNTGCFDYHTEVELFNFIQYYTFYFIKITKEKGKKKIDINTYFA
jgi:hypothetical protein